jgi:hypothetical protein
MTEICSSTVVTSVTAYRRLFIASSRLEPSGLESVAGAQHYHPKLDRTFIMEVVDCPSLPNPTGWSDG